MEQRSGLRWESSSWDKPQHQDTDQTGEETRAPHNPKAFLAGNGLTAPNPHYTGSSTREGPLARPIPGCGAEGLMLSLHSGLFLTLETVQSYEFLKHSICLASRGRELTFQPSAGPRARAADRPATE